MRITDKDKVFILDVINKHGDTNLFPIPFEYGILDPKELLNDLNKWEPKHELKYLVPKSLYGFRNVSMMDPIDLILYSTFIFTLVKGKEEKINKDYIYSDIISVDELESKFLEWNYADFIKDSIIHSKKTGYILITDIADYYSRIYLHDIERSFHTLFGADAENIAGKFFKSRNSTETIGVLPTGPVVSGLVSNIVIRDADIFLEHRGIKFSRFVDDYRIYVSSLEEAHETLFLLSDYLNKRYNLTLQAGKTRIDEAGDYENNCSQNLESFKDGELYNLMIDVAGDEIRESMELTSSYEVFIRIVNDLVSGDERDLVINKLIDEVEQSLSPKKINEKIVKKLIEIGTSFKLPGLENILLNNENISKSFILFPSIVRYLIENKEEIGDMSQVKDFFLNLLKGNNHHLNNIIYYQVWVLHFLSNISNVLTLIDMKILLRMFDESNDILVRRMFILLFGVMKMEFWFREKKKEYIKFSDWEKRAFVYSFSQCEFSKSENFAFMKSIKGTLGDYEKPLFELLK